MLLMLTSQLTKQSCCRFTLELDAITWHLCQDRTPFVDASIMGVMLDSIQNKDLSGQLAHFTSAPAKDHTTHTCYRQADSDSVLPAANSFSRCHLQRHPMQHDLAGNCQKTVYSAGAGICKRHRCAEQQMNVTTSNCASIRSALRCC